MYTADNGNRTRLSSLGSWRSTDELYPHEISITVNDEKEKKKVKKFLRKSLFKSKTGTKPEPEEGNSNKNQSRNRITNTKVWTEK